MKLQTPIPQLTVTLESKDGTLPAGTMIQLLVPVKGLSVPPKGKVELMYCTGSRWELVSKNF